MVVPTQNNSEPLGWMQLDVRDLQAHRLTNKTFDLRGAKPDSSPMRLVLDAKLAFHNGALCGLRSFCG